VDHPEKPNLNRANSKEKKEEKRKRKKGRKNLLTGGDTLNIASFTAVYLRLSSATLRF